MGFFWNACEATFSAMPTCYVLRLTLIANNGLTLSAQLLIAKCLFRTKIAIVPWGCTKLLGGWFQLVVVSSS